MLWRIICLLFNHREDWHQFGTKIVRDASGAHRFGIKACERCGEVYLAFHARERGEPLPE